MFMDCCPSQDTQGIKLVLLSILTQGFLSLSSLNFRMFYKYTQSTALNCSDSTFAAKAAQSSLQQVRRLRGPEQLGVSTKTNPFVVTAPVSQWIPKKMTNFTTEPSSRGCEPAQLPKATLTFLCQPFLLHSLWSACVLAQLSCTQHCTLDLNLWLKRVCKVFHQQVELRNSILYNPLTIWIFFRKPLHY